MKEEMTFKRGNTELTTFLTQKKNSVAFSWTEKKSWKEV